MALTLVVGQVYHALLQERDDKGINDVVISRVEQISPFPYDLVSAPYFLLLSLLLTALQITPHLDKYPNADLMWCQASYPPYLRGSELTFL